MSKNPNPTLSFNVPEVSKWYLFSAIACIVAIALYLITLTLPIASHVTKYYIANSILWAVIAITGIPVILQIFINIIKGEFGVDMLAVLSIILACCLGEYLAATLVILMLTGGQALETYAMRKASSVLLALAKRMPAIAHKKEGDFLIDINKIPGFKLFGKDNENRIL